MNITINPTTQTIQIIGNVNYQYLEKLFEQMPEAKQWTIAIIPEHQVMELSVGTGNIIPATSYFPQNVKIDMPFQTSTIIDTSTIKI